MKKRTIAITAIIAFFALTVVSCDLLNEEDEQTDELMEKSTEETIEGANSVEEVEDEEDGKGDSETVTFQISGTNYAFSETELKVSEGDTVHIVFTSEDGFHDWVVDEFNAATEQVQTGGITEVTFVADKAGTYEYYCSVGQHRANGMFGTLIVE